MNVRFAELCREEPLKLIKAEEAVFAENTKAAPCHECEQDIFLGFFFDGTNNNKFRDTSGFGHSNVARLYESFIGTPAQQQEPKLAPAVSGVREIFPDKKYQPQGFPAQDFQYYRKVYMPGVGTPFPEVGDLGAGADKKLGLGMAFLGEARLCWALLQVCNQVHAAITGKALQDNLPFVVPIAGLASHTPEFVGRLAADYEKLLRERLVPLEAQLAKAIAERGEKKPKIRRIRLSVFGFSRGAAAARAFVNRVVRHWGSGVCGIPLEIDMLGIFDTVASVGIAQSVPGADGHFAWATGLNLTVPSQVRRCVHLVAAHEVRASFPLDSIGKGGRLSSNCKEIVYPGVHSDVGGGYPPGDQGRALGVGAQGDCLKLSQVALAQMYREARMAGVPLGAPTQLDSYQIQNFAISPTLRADFNAYVEATRTGRVPATNGRGDASFAKLFPTEEQPRHSLDALVTTHYAYFLQWRKLVLRHAHELPGLAKSTNASSRQDIEDIRGADLELAKELAFLEDQNPKKFKLVDDPAMEAARRAPKVLSAVAGLAGPFGAALGSVGGGQLGNKVDKMMLATMEEKQRQWDLTLKQVWFGEAVLKGKAAADVRKLFECYLHDSRAWFKALYAQDGHDNDLWYAKSLKAVIGLDGYEMAPDDEDWFTLGGRDKEKAVQRAALRDRLAAQKKAGDLTGATKTQKALDDLEAYGPLVSGGREPYRLYGYLRFRKIYQSGSISFKDSKWQVLVQQEENERRKDDQIAQENARHEAEKKKILDAEHRVITEGRLKGTQLDEYLYGSKQTLEAENRRHAENLKAIEHRA